MKKIISIILAVVMAVSVFVIPTSAKASYNAAFTLSAKANGKDYVSGDTITVAPGDTVTVKFTFKNDFYTGGVAAQVFYNSDIFKGATAAFNKNGRLYDTCGGMLCTYNDWDKIASSNQKNWWPDYSSAKLTEFKKNHKFCYMTMTANPNFSMQPAKDLNELLITYTFTVKSDAKIGTTGQILIPAESAHRKDYFNGRTMCAVYTSTDMTKPPVNDIDGLTYNMSKAVLNFKVAAKSGAGDVDNNGSINSADALMVLQYSVGKLTLTATQKKAADVDGSGSINSADALKILQYSVGTISSL